MLTCTLFTNGFVLSPSLKWQSDLTALLTPQTNYFSAILAGAAVRSFDMNNFELPAVRAMLTYFYTADFYGSLSSVERNSLKVCADIWRLARDLDQDWIRQQALADMRGHLETLATTDVGEFVFFCRDVYSAPSRGFDVPLELREVIAKIVFENLSAPIHLLENSLCMQLFCDFEMFRGDCLYWADYGAFEPRAW